MTDQMHKKFDQKMNEKCLCANEKKEPSQELVVDLRKKSWVSISSQMKLLVHLEYQ